MLAVLQAEGAELVQRGGHAQSRSICEPVTAVHIQLLQAAGCRASAERPDAHVCDALTALQDQTLHKADICQTCSPPGTKVLQESQQILPRPSRFAVVVQTPTMAKERAVWGMCSCQNFQIRRSPWISPGAGRGQRWRRG